MAPVADLPVSYAPSGVKSPEAPTTWPFGTQTPAPAAPAAEAPPVAPPKAELNADTPLDFLLAVMRNTDEDKRVRLQAASLAAPYIHAKPAPAGKKSARADAAKKAGEASKFATATPPRLVSSR